MPLLSKKSSVVKSDLAAVAKSASASSGCRVEVCLTMPLLSKKRSVV